MEPGDQKALEDIERYGCHILHILEEGEHPRFSYSIGIQKQSGQPELIVTGLKRDLAHSIINQYNTRVRAGETFQLGQFYSGFLEGFDVTFREVEQKHYREYFGWGLWLYKGDNFRVLQLIYPSTSGVWPWDKNPPADYTWFIPRLYAT